MGRPDGLDRLVQLLIALAALVAVANGAAMLFVPLHWYERIPTVRFTGPPNMHFIRDIGLAYLGCGAILVHAALFPAGRWLAAVAGALWLSAHGMLHIYEALTGICSPENFWMDAPGVLGPPLLVWIGIFILVARQRIAPAGVPARMLVSVLDRIAPGESALCPRTRRRAGPRLREVRASHAGDDASPRRACCALSHGADRRGPGRGLRPVRDDGGQGGAR